MIYDIILFLNHTPDIQWNNKTFGIITGFIIVVFYMLDYVLLHTDLDYITPFEKKSWTYVLCDFAISSLFFLGFVFSKYGEINCAILCLGIVPILFALYNWCLKVFKWHHVGFCIPSSFIVSYYLIIHCHFKLDNLKIDPEKFLFYQALIYTSAYFIYNLICFWIPKNRE